MPSTGGGVPDVNALFMGLTFLLSIVSSAIVLHGTVNSARDYGPVEFFQMLFVFSPDDFAAKCGQQRDQHADNQDEA